MSVSALSRYFSCQAGLCSVKSSSPCGLPQSTSATFTPASDNRLAAQPPEAPDPTTITSNLRASDGCGTRSWLPLDILRFTVAEQLMEPCPCWVLGATCQVRCLVLGAWCLVRRCKKYVGPNYSSANESAELKLGPRYAQHEARSTRHRTQHPAPGTAPGTQHSAQSTVI